MQDNIKRNTTRHTSLKLKLPTQHIHSQPQHTLQRTQHLSKQHKPNNDRHLPHKPKTRIQALVLHKRTKQRKQHEQMRLRYPQLFRRVAHLPVSEFVG